MSNKLSEDEISSFLKTMLSLTLNREQLMNPNKELVVNIYARFMTEFGIENVAQPDIIATSGMDNIEVYETNIILANLTKSVASIVQNAGVPDMSFSDLVQPKKNRTLRIISALCMLHYKLTEIESRFTHKEDKCRDLPVKRKGVEQRILDMKKYIEEKAMFLSSNKNKNQNLGQELKDLAESYEAKKKAAAQLADESRQLKTYILSQREKISEEDIELSKLKEDIHELEQKIVKSPDRIQADTKEKEVELETKRNEKKKLEKQYMELVRSVDFLKEASKSLMPSLETFIDAFKDIENMKSQCESLCQTKLSVTKKEEQLKTFRVQLKEQEKTVQTLKTQVVNNEKQFHKKMQTMRQICDGMKVSLKQETESKTKEERNKIKETLRLQKKMTELEDQEKKFKDLFISVSEIHSQKISEVQTLIGSHLGKIRVLSEKQNMKTFYKN